MKDRALVIGGAGFVGQHTVEELVREGFDTTVFDLPGAIPPLGDGPRSSTAFIEGSVGDRNDVARAFDAAKPELVVVVAAYGSAGLGLVQSGELHPEAATMTNVVGLVNILEEAKKRQARRVVWASSTTVYGPADRYPGPVNEESLMGPQSVYAASKVFGEQLIRTYRERHDLDAVAVRPTLVWGPGIRYRGVQAALGDMVDAATSEHPVIVHSGDEPWDLIYVKDAARAFVVVALAESAPPVVLVSGYVASIDQIREAVLDHVPHAPITVADEAPMLGLPLVDTAIARNLGFTPRYELTPSVVDYLATVEQYTPTP